MIPRNETQPSDVADFTALADTHSLAAFIRRQRWFGGKALTVSDITIIDSMQLSEAAWLAIVGVDFADGRTERYVVPLALTNAKQAVANDTAVREMEDGRCVIDGMFDDTCCLALRQLLTECHQVDGARGRLRAAPVGRAAVPPSELHAIHRTGADQSNTSVVFGSSVILKVFRRLEPGPNPDVELGVFLTRQQFRHTPETIAAAEYTATAEPPAAVAILQRYVPNRGNAWQVILSSLADRLTRRTKASGDLDLALPRRLGSCTGELHAVLAASAQPDIASEPFDSPALKAIAVAMRERANRQLDLLESALPRLDSTARRDAETVLHARRTILDVFSRLPQLRDAGRQIRCHGDFHLGQTLITEDEDVVILDFEGEPARPLNERRARSSPLRDVAGMLRSFSYVAEAAIREAKPAATADEARMRQLVRAWQTDAETAFVASYQEAARPSGILPRDEDTFRALQRAYVVDKATYELGYELNNRPDWIGIPLSGILDLLAAP